jgi:acetyl-CoA carboxylase biotin carboxyl carrier protein
MVGTYYAKPDPDADPFITVGAEITEETTVCIIEAMKVFNEIKAETAGTVERILVENEAPVEYGQPLILVRPPA